MSVDDGANSNTTGGDAGAYTSESQSMNTADVDSGIEGMEVDEVEARTEAKRKRVCFFNLENNF